MWRALKPFQCAAWYCKPFLYGRIAQRLDFFPHNNPAEIQTFDKHCCFFSCAANLYMCCLPTAFKREEIRERFGIKGHLFWDILVSSDKLRTSCLPCGGSADEDDAGFDVLHGMHSGADELRDEEPCS